MKILKQFDTNYIDKYKNLEREFDNMSRFATIVFGNIASISKVERVGERALSLAPSKNSNSQH
jgi:hypothetical protein